VPEKTARASKDLKRYALKGALRVEYLERGIDMSKYPMQVPGTRGRGNRALAPRQRVVPPNKAVPKVEEEPQVPSVTDAKVNIEFLNVQKELMREVRRMRQVCESLETAIQALIAQQRTLPGSMLGAVQALAASLREQERVDAGPDLRGKSEMVAWLDDANFVPNKGNSKGVLVEEEREHPMFIPSNLVDKEQSVSVDSSDSSSDSVEDSVAQLRAMEATRKDEER
jgi:hypothetical protein